VLAGHVELLPVRLHNTVASLPRRG
jgi:hypothetical protein